MEIFLRMVKNTMRSKTLREEVVEREVVTTLERDGINQEFQLEREAG